MPPLFVRSRLASSYVDSEMRRRPREYARRHAVPGLRAELRRDLRGRHSKDHEPYSKRAIARDMVAVTQHFGFERFGVAGHDRGARVGYRLALDHPARVDR